MIYVSTTSPLVITVTVTESRMLADATTKEGEAKVNSIHARCSVLYYTVFNCSQLYCTLVYCIVL